MKGRRISPKTGSKPHENYSRIWFFDLGNHSGETEVRTCRQSQKVAGEVTRCTPERQRYRGPQERPYLFFVFFFGGAGGVIRLLTLTS